MSVVPVRRSFSSTREGSTTIAGSSRAVRLVTICIASIARLIRGKMNKAGGIEGALTIGRATAKEVSDLNHPPKTINKAGDSRNVEIRSFGQGEKFGQPSLTETTEDSRGTFRSIVHRVDIALRALYKPSNPAPAFKIFPIPDEHLPKCAGCGAQWDNHDTGCYCMWGREPSECEGPNEP